MKTKKSSLAMKAVSALSACAVLTSLGTFHATAYAATATSVQQSVDSVINPLVTNGDFSGAVLLEKHGTVLAEKAYGLANVANSQPNTVDTRFAIGTITQTFVAAAILQLVQEGLLSLKDPVSTFFPNNPNTVGQNITVGELLTQTSGAPASSTGTASMPGTVFQYSPLNYVLAGQIIKSVTGVSAATYIQQNILTPLGMNNTGFLSTTMSAVPNSATGYDNANPSSSNQGTTNQGTANQNGSTQTVTPVDFGSQQFAGSDNMYSTIGDLYKWDQALYSGKIINRQYVQELFLPTSLSVQALKTYGYGLGWEVSLGTTRAEVESTVPGYESFIYRDMANDETLIILSNRDWAPMVQMAQKLQTILAQAPISTPSLTSTVGGQKQIVVNGKTISQPDSRVALSTTFMPIWYVGQALQSLGIQQSWDGTNRIWNITLPSTAKTDFSNVDLGTGNTDIYVNGQLVKRINTYAWPDPATGNKSITTYAPIFYIQQIISQVGIKNTWDGQSWTATTN
ncbi:serine hydrolase [Alicyclobacillus tolerans]|uniref:serine hydrolase n=1 Tax=Alicyclobacillus tolerans TaxID=90970 RepID=UPI001F24F238|nr:serine hydrolase [Alicyclobacillus tolerans]MCF8565083.1 serine hydrolase [Alicyclobacillus tolerans]